MLYGYMIYSKKLSKKHSKKLAQKCQNLNDT